MPKPIFILNNVDVKNQIKKTYIFSTQEVKANETDIVIKVDINLNDNIITLMAKIIHYCNIPYPYVYSFYDGVYYGITTVNSIQSLCNPFIIAKDDVNNKTIYKKYECIYDDLANIRNIQLGKDVAYTFDFISLVDFASKSNSFISKYWDVYGDISNIKKNIKITYNSHIESVLESIDKQQHIDNIVNQEVDDGAISTSVVLKAVYFNVPGDSSGNNILNLQTLQQLLGYSYNVPSSIYYQSQSSRPIQQYYNKLISVATDGAIFADLVSLRFGKHIPTSIRVGTLAIKLRMLQKKDDDKIAPDDTFITMMITSTGEMFIHYEPIVDLKEHIADTYYVKLYSIDEIISNINHFIIKKLIPLNCFRYGYTLNPVMSDNIKLINMVANIDIPADDGVNLKNNFPLFKSSLMDFDNIYLFTKVTGFVNLMAFYEEVAQCMLTEDEIVEKYSISLSELYDIKERYRSKTLYELLKGCKFIYNMDVKTMKNFTVYNIQNMQEFGYIITTLLALCHKFTKANYTEILRLNNKISTKKIDDVKDIQIIKQVKSDNISSLNIFDDFEDDTEPIIISPTKPESPQKSKDVIDISNFKQKDYSRIRYLQTLLPTIFQSNDYAQNTSKVKYSKLVSRKQQPIGMHADQYEILYKKIIITRSQEKDPFIKAQIAYDVNVTFGVDAKKYGVIEYDGQEYNFICPRNWSFVHKAILDEDSVIEYIKPKSELIVGKSYEFTTIARTIQDGVDIPDVVVLHKSEDGHTFLVPFHKTVTQREQMVLESIVVKKGDIKDKKVLPNEKKVTIPYCITKIEQSNKFVTDDDIKPDQENVNKIVASIQDLEKLKSRVLQSGKIPDLGILAGIPQQLANIFDPEKFIQQGLGNMIGFQNMVALIYSIITSNSLSPHVINSFISQIYTKEMFMVKFGGNFPSLFHPGNIEAGKEVFDEYFQSNKIDETMFYDIFTDGEIFKASKIESPPHINLFIFRGDYNVDKLDYKLIVPIGFNIKSMYKFDSPNVYVVKIYDSYSIILRKTKEMEVIHPPSKINHTLINLLIKYPNTEHFNLPSEIINSIKVFNKKQDNVLQATQKSPFVEDIRTIFSISAQATNSYHKTIEVLLKFKDDVLRYPVSPSQFIESVEEYDNSSDHNLNPWASTLMLLNTVHKKIGLNTDPIGIAVKDGKLMGFYLSTGLVIKCIPTKMEDFERDVTHNTKIAILPTYLYKENHIINDMILKPEDNIDGTLDTLSILYYKREGYYRMLYELSKYLLKDNYFKRALMSITESSQLHNRQGILDDIKPFVDTFAKRKIYFGEPKENPKIYNTIPSVRTPVEIDPTNPFARNGKLFILVENDDEIEKIIVKLLNEICFNNLIRQQMINDTYPIKSVLYKTIYNESSEIMSILTNEEARRELQEKIENSNNTSIKVKYKNLYDILIISNIDACYAVKADPITFAFPDQSEPQVYFSVNLSDPRCTYDILASIIGTTASILLNELRSKIIKSRRLPEYEKESHDVNVGKNKGLLFQNITKIELEMIGNIYKNINVYTISDDSIKAVGDIQDKEYIRFAFDVRTIPYRIIGVKQINDYRYNLHF